VEEAAKEQFTKTFKLMTSVDGNEWVEWVGGVLEGEYKPSTVQVSASARDRSERKKSASEASAKRARANRSEASAKRARSEASAKRDTLLIERNKRNAHRAQQEKRSSHTRTLILRSSRPLFRPPGS
jgi:hypothetical protein